MPPVQPIQTDLLTSLLRDVSRSFYKTLRWLPRAVRSQISLAYLLARATDTVADTQLVPVEERLDALRALRERILGELAEPLEFSALAGRQGSEAERRLLERIEEAIETLALQPVGDQQMIRDVLRTITSGQELDLRRFAGASADKIVALRTDDELDDYTYRVAGCVGEFWTKTCLAHLFPGIALDRARLLEDGIRFGKGLQLVNILRDLPADLRQGRCYLAEEKLQALGLRPADLLRPESEPRLRSYYEALLDRAASHLRAGWSYTNALPRSGVRMRLACAWPVLIGVRTLARLRRQNVLEAGQRIKISRAEVRGLILRSIFSHPWQGAWNRLYDRAASN